MIMAQHLSEVLDRRIYVHVFACRLDEVGAVVARAPPGLTHANRVACVPDAVSRGFLKLAPWLYN
ncbi:MAG: hypothetical protein JW808_09580 [Victivallales bacterium]|nr:hypothetical protein [Victivallales bacterium]